MKLIKILMQQLINLLFQINQQNCHLFSNILSRNFHLVRLQP